MLKLNNIIKQLEKDFPPETLYDENGNEIEVIIVQNSNGEYVDMNYYINKLKEIRDEN